MRTTTMQASDVAVVLRFAQAGAPTSTAAVHQAMHLLGNSVSRDTAKNAASRANGFVEFERAVHLLLAQGGGGVVLMYRGSDCPQCGTGQLQLYKSYRETGGKVCWLFTQDRAVHKAVLKRKHCNACGVIVGPGYFYFKHRSSNRQPPVRDSLDPAAGEEEADGLSGLFAQQGGGSSCDCGDDAEREQLQERHYFVLHGQGQDSALIMADGYQRLFMQERLVEELHLQQVHASLSTQAIHRLLMMSLRLADDPQYRGCCSQGAASQVICVPGLDDWGLWIQYALDLLVIKQQCQQRAWCVRPQAVRGLTGGEQQQLGGDGGGGQQAAPLTDKLLYVLKHPLKAARVGGGLCDDDEGVCSDSQKGGEEVEGTEDEEVGEEAAAVSGLDTIGGAADADSAQQPVGDMAQRCAASEAALLAAADAAGVPCGTPHTLLDSLLAQPFKDKAGNLGASHVCMVEETTTTCRCQDVPVLLVDGTRNIQLRACGVPGCKDEPAHGNATFCKAHAAESGGCSVIVRNTSQPTHRPSAWRPCPYAKAGRTTCEHHEGLEEQHGIAAQHEVHGAQRKPSQRWDKTPLSTTPVGGEAVGGEVVGTVGPRTPQPKISRGRRRYSTIGSEGGPLPFAWGTPGASSQQATASQPAAGDQTGDGAESAAAPAGAPAQPAGAAAASAAQQPGWEGEDDADADDDAAVYINPRPKRDIVVVTCAKCGLVLGCSPLWSGAPETSEQGLGDVLSAVISIAAQHRLTPDPLSSQQQQEQQQDRPPMKVVLVYNDADLMMQHMAASATAPVSTVQWLWCVDPFRFLPKQVGANTRLQAAQQLLVAVQQQQRQQQSQQGDGVSSSLGLAPDTLARVREAAAAAKRAVELIAGVSPFRHDLDGLLWRAVAIPTGCQLASLLETLLQQLPHDANPDSEVWQQAAERNSAVAWLRRKGGVRVQGGAVSSKEMHRVLGMLVDGDFLQNQLVRGLPGVSHDRLFFVLEWVPGSNGAAGSEVMEGVEQQGGGGAAVSSAAGAVPGALHSKRSRRKQKKLNQGVAAAAAAALGSSALPVADPDGSGAGSTKHKKRKLHQPQGEPSAAAAAAAGGVGGGEHEQGRWRVVLIEVMVDCEALEQLFSRLQPGNTLHLKTQVHGIVQLWSQLSLRNRQVQLQVAEVRQAAVEAANSSGGADTFADMLWQPPPEEEVAGDVRSGGDVGYGRSSSSGGETDGQQQQPCEDAVVADAQVGKRPLSRSLLRGRSSQTLMMVRGAPLANQLMRGTTAIH